MNEPVRVEPAMVTETSINSITPLVEANLAALLEGKTVLASLSDEQYRASCAPAFRSTLGAHYRHLVEHYICFLNSLSANSGLVCYASRERDSKIEQNRSYALQVIEDVCEALRAMALDSDAATEISMRDQKSLQPVASNLARELLFLQSHTVHHHAMIAGMCRTLNHAVPENFGIAIATQSFEAAQAACRDSQPEPEEHA